MTRATFRELARGVDTWIFAAFFPLAVAVQFIGNRDAITVAVYIAVIVGCGWFSCAVMWRRAARRARATAARLAEQQLIADHAAWMAEHDARRNDRSTA